MTLKMIIILVMMTMRQTYFVKMTMNMIIILVLMMMITMRIMMKTADQGKLT